jgi:plastocyanin
MHQRFPLIIIAAFTLVACGGEKQSQPVSATQTSASAAAGPVTPDAGGKIIVIEMSSDEKGNYFAPNKIEARKGDVLRFTLKLGVHSVHFLPDSNPGKTDLPPVSDLLQLPGQTYDFKVTFAPGTYYFQCDPHAALGMIGHLTVTN